MLPPHPRFAPCQAVPRILPGMPTTELTDDAREVLRVVAAHVERHEVMTVQAAAIGAGLSYMETYDLVNQLFSAGMLTHDLRLTDAGQKAID